MRAVGPWLFAFSLFLPEIARAAPESSGAREPEHGIDVIGEAGADALRSRGLQVVAVPEIGFSAAWRASRRLAFGLTGAVGGTSMSGPADALTHPDGAYASDGTLLWKGAALVRYDYLILGPLRAWGRGDVGLAFAHNTFDVWSGGKGLGAVSNTRTAPYVAALTGVEVRLGPYVSLGVRAGGEILAFGSPMGTGAGIGATAMGFCGGLDLGFHVPMD
jgi:hypothetical protein